MASANKPAFGSSVGRTFGSPFSGYRGDYTIYPDEPWRISLRKYPYPITEKSPVRSSRSVSPRRRHANAQDATKRRALEEIMAKIDTTQEDLHALARKVALWSREAASLSEGFKEEALLLNLSRQADLLAASEEQNREMQKQERVYRLSMENSELRRELRQLVRICKLLLERRAIMNDQSVGETDDPRDQSSCTPPRQVWEAEEGYDSERRGATDKPSVNVASSGCIGNGSDVPYATSHVATAPLTPVSGTRRQLSYVASLDESRIAAGLEGLTEENAAYIVAADRAQADADADPNGLASRLRPGSRVPDAAAARSSDHAAARSHGGRYEKEVTMQAGMFRQEYDCERRQVQSQLNTAEVDNALKELTLNAQSCRGSGGGSGAAPAQSGTGTLASMPTFGGFLQQDEAVESTPAVPEVWHRQQQTVPSPEQYQDGAWPRKEQEQEAEINRVEQELAAAERELAEAVAEEAAAASAAEEAAAAAKVAEAKAAAQVAAAEAATAAAAAAAIVTTAVGSENKDGKSFLVAPVGTPSKPGDGALVPVPPTPVYPAVVYSGNDGSLSTVRRDVQYTNRELSRTGPYSRSVSSSSEAAAAPLDSVLQTEVEKLKMINKTLANTLQSYNRVADRLSDAVIVTGTATALSTSQGRTATSNAAVAGSSGIRLSALLAPSTKVESQPSSSVAATCGTSLSSSVPGTLSSTYTPSYPLGVSTRAVAAPSTPPPIVRHLRPEELRVSWAPSSLPRERRYSGNVGSTVVGEVRRLDAALDDQLYGIRQQLQALRHDMIADRLATLTASAPGSGGATAITIGPSSPPVVLTTARRTPAAGGTVTAISTPLGTGGTSYREALKLARLHDEVSELRRQVRDDRRWYQNSLETVVTERSTMFRDLQRRIDRLMTSAI